MNADGDEGVKAAKEKKIFIIDRTVMSIDSNCLEAFEDNIIIIPIAELQAVGERAKAKIPDFGSWEFTQNMQKYGESGSWKSGIRTKSGGLVSIDYNGSRFNKLPHGMLHSQENRIYLVAIEKLEQLCKKEEKAKGRKLTEKEKKNLKKRVIIVSFDPILLAMADLVNIEAQRYRSSNFISSIKDLYTGKAYLKIDATLNDVINEAIKDFAKIDAQKIAKYVDLGKLYPNQCCTLNFRDKVVYGIYKKSQGVFNIVKKIDQNKEKREKRITPKNIEHCFFEALARDNSINMITIAGTAGSGKSVMVAKAGLDMMDKDEGMGIIVYRPLVETGNSMGYLPGNVNQKTGPFLEPMVKTFCFVENGGKSSRLNRQISNTEQAMYAKKNGMNGTQKILEYIQNGIISMESINFIQGSTNHDTWMIIDEAQDFIKSETKALTTRIGDRGKILMTGDLSQVHREGLCLQPVSSGFAWIIESSKQSERIAHITFTEVLRHPLVEEIANFL